MPKVQRSVAFCSLAVAFSLCLAAWATLVAAAPLGAQSVEGTLVDSDANLPIAGARVILLDADHEQVRRTTTDIDGRFMLRAADPGIYMLVAERDGYATTLSEPLELGFQEPVSDYVLTISALRSAPEEQIPVENAVAAEELDPYEAAQRFAAMIRQACEPRYEPDQHGILVGVVRDSVARVPLPMVEAKVEWQGAPDSTAEVRVDFDPGTGAPRTYNQLSGLTDEEGAYLICNAPADQPLQLWAAAGTESQGRRLGIRLKPGTMQRRDLVLPLTTETRPGDIWGQVMDRNSNRPIRGVEVTIEELNPTIGVCSPSRTCRGVSTSSKPPTWDTPTPLRLFDSREDGLIRWNS